MMYSENEKLMEIPETFAARELQLLGHSSAPDDVVDYMEKTGCNFDTLRRMDYQKSHPELFILWRFFEDFFHIIPNKRYFYIKKVSVKMYWPHKVGHKNLTLWGQYKYHFIF